MKFLMFILYRYYRKGTFERAPYLHALSVVALLIMLHLCQLFIVFRGYLFSDLTEQGTSHAIFFGLIPVPLLMGVRLLVPPSTVRRASYDHELVRRGYIWLVTYAFLSLACTLVLAYIYL